IEDIEWESTQVEALRALEAGTAALNKLHEEMSVDDVERLLEESNEAIEIENEISALLAGQFSVQDESELEEELEALYAQEMGTSMTPTIAGDSKEGLSLPTVPNTPVLPTVPSHSVDAALEEPTSAVLA
ncbi:CHMP6, partial [Symbiodinium microadriaticum]